MKRLAMVLGVATILAVFWLGSPARADDTYMGGVGGDVYPLYSADIRLETETVQATMFADFAEFRVDFRFVNDGPEQSVQLGFPFAITSADEAYLPGPIAAFRAWRNGRPLAVTLGRSTSKHSAEGGNPGMGYFLHQATFPPGPTVITVSYLARPSETASTRFPELAPTQFKQLYNGWSWYEYWLHTGASWKGTIGEALIRFNLADSFLGWGADIRTSDIEGPYVQGTTSPESYTRPDARTFQWVFRDFEPNDTPVDDPHGLSRYDLRLFYSQPQFATAPPGVTVPDVGPRIVAATASGTLPDSQSTSGLGYVDVFAPMRAADGNPATAWAVPSGAGESVWISFALSGSHPVQEVRLVSGNNQTPTSYRECSRPKTIRLSFSDGATTTLHLADEPGLQRFPVSTEAAGGARLDVLEVYPGTANSDTYLSEVEFGMVAAPAFAALQGFERTGLAATAPPAATATATTIAVTTTSTVAEPTTSRGSSSTETSSTVESAAMTATTVADPPSPGEGGGGLSGTQVVLMASGGLVVLLAILAVVVIRRRARVS